MALAGAGRGLTLVNGAVLTIAAIRGRPIVLGYLDSRFAPALWRVSWGLAWAVAA